jgi:hypothetical protein
MSSHCRCELASEARTKTGSELLLLLLIAFGKKFHRNVLNQMIVENNVWGDFLEKTYFKSEIWEMQNLNDFFKPNFNYYHRDSNHKISFRFSHYSICGKWVYLKIFGVSVEFRWWR